MNEDTGKIAVPNGRAQMNIVIAGHVDHGKSTVIGRLLADTGSLPEGKLEQVKKNCELSSKPFEYAFLIDALKNEQSQGITIDSARVFFKTEARDYIIIDAPGHIEFLKNMVSGASRAEAAFLVIDAEEGIQENSRRHGYMLSMLGIEQICILVNKMDLVDYSSKVFHRIERRFSRFLKSIDIDRTVFIPVSGMEGENISVPSPKMDWFEGPTLLLQLDSFAKEAPRENLPFRMPVQDVYKFTRYGDKRRIVAGTIETGSIGVGDEVVFYPSGKRSVVKSIEGFNINSVNLVSAPSAAGFTLEEQIFLTRGEIAAKVSEPQPEVGTRIRVNIFWLGQNPMVPEKAYHLKIGTAKVEVRLEEVIRVINSSSLTADAMKEKIGRHEVADCILSCRKPLAYDLVGSLPKTSRFVIVDDFEIWGGGIIREGLSDRQKQVRDNIIQRNYNWQTSHISPWKRAERYSQKSTVVILSGKHNDGKNEIGKMLEEELFNQGKLVYFLGIGSLQRGVNADLRELQKDSGEAIRRLAELSYIFLDAGLILIVTAVELTQEDVQLVKLAVAPGTVHTVWVGEELTTDLTTDLHITDPGNADEAVSMIKELLQKHRIIFNPY